MNNEPKIIQIDATTWRIEEEGVRFFLLVGTKDALLIDCGMNTTNAKVIAERLTNLPVKLLLTHADMDHVGSTDQFTTFYMNPAEASNFYKTQNKKGIFVPVYGGDILDLGDRKLEIIDLPGHTPGSIAILDHSQGVLYGGDSIQDGVIFMFGIQREIHAYISSLKKLSNYKGLYDIVYTSHSTFPVSPSIIPRLIEGAVQVSKKQLEGKPVELFGHVKGTLYDFGAAKLLMDEDY